MRLGLPLEPEPLGRAVTDGYVAAQTPLLVVPSMAGGDTIDGTTLRFLLEHCLRMKTLLEEEERRKEEEKEKEKATRSSASSAPKRTRKKRKKKKTPKTSSSRAVRTQKSGHSSTSSSWYVYSGGVMSSVAFGSSILLGICRLLQHSAISVLDCAYSWTYGVKVATFIWTWWRTRVVLPSMLAGFAGYDAHRAVFPSFVALADEARGDSTGAVLVQGDMPVVIASGAFDQTAQKTVEIPQLPFVDEVVHISCRSAQADSHGLALQQTMVIPQFQFLNEVIDVLVVQVARVLPCPCVAIPQVQFLDKVICPWWNDRFYCGVPHVAETWARWSTVARCCQQQVLGV